MTMLLPFLTGGGKVKRDQMFAVDLGGRTTKAVHLQRRGQGYTLRSFIVADAPIFEKNISADLLCEHLKTLTQGLPERPKWITLTTNVNDAVVRTVEMPKIPKDEIRNVLKHNSRTYLQQELTGYTFDCHVITAYQQAHSSDPAQSPGSLQKQRVLAAGAKQQLIDDFVDGARKAGFTPDHIVPGLLGPINAFELAMPEVFKKENVALIDLGFRNSSISILQRGELVLSRVVSIGGDRLTSSLSEVMKISYAEAEGIKIGMPAEVLSNLEPMLTPLGRELRASIDFFEHQQDRPVSHVYVSGAAARSEAILQALQVELMHECKTWNPVPVLHLELPAQQTAEIEQMGPQLIGAVGAALTAL